MSMPPYVPTAISLVDLVSFSMTCSVGGPYSGSLNVENASLQYSTTLIGTVITITVDCTGTAVSCNGDTAALFVNRVWVRGVIASYEDGQAISKKEIVLGYRSFFARLAQHPINTEKFTDPLTALTDVATKYCGIPIATPPFFSFTLNGGVMGDCVSGSNTLDEMKRLAQAGRAMLFVSDDGVLTATPWKTSSSAIDWTIPDVAVVSAKRSVNEDILPSRIKVRGAFVSKRNLGKKKLGGTGGGSGGGGGGGGGGDQGPRGPKTKCFKNGMFDDQAQMQIGGLAADRQDLMNAEVTVAGGTLVETNDIRDGEMDVTIDTGMQTGDFEAEVDVEGEVQPKDEHENAGVKNARIRDANRGARQRLQFMAQAMGASPDSMMGQAGGPSGGEGGGGSSDKTADEAVEGQFEMTVTDDGLLTRYGSTIEEIDNRYLVSKEQMFDTAVQRFLELRMSKFTWDVQLRLVPGLALYDVVKFGTEAIGQYALAVPPAPPRTNVVGIVTSMRVSYAADPIAASMDLTVTAFDDIGSQTYTSENLLYDPDVTTASVVSGVADSSTGTGKVYFGDGGATLYSTGGSGTDKSILTITYINMEAGARYTFSCSFTGASVLFEVIHGGATVYTTTGSGSLSCSLVASATSVAYRFTLATGRGVLTLPKLVKIVVK